MSLLLLFQGVSASLAASGRRDAAGLALSQDLPAALAAMEVRDVPAFSLSQRLAAALVATDSHDVSAFTVAQRLGAALAGVGSHDAPSFSLSQTIVGTLATTGGHDAAAFAAAVSVSVTFDASVIGGHAAFSVSVSSRASTNVWTLQMWTVRASVQADEDFRAGPLTFFAADGVTPLDLTGIAFTARIGAATLTSAAGQIFVSGNALSFFVPAGSVAWRSGRFGFSLLAEDGLRAHEIFANSALTVGLPMSFSATPFGSRAPSVELLNTPLNRV